MSVPRFECELLMEWLIDMSKNEGKYFEPVLDTRSTSLIKEVCNMLEQDIHVFTFAVDTLEEYISRKNIRQQQIDDPGLTLAATVFICSKYVGNQNVQIKSVLHILKILTGQMYDGRTINLKEIEILTTLDNNLPIKSTTDDLKTFITMFEKQSRIKTSVLKLTCEILEMMYLTRKKWFYSLKSAYTINSDAFEVFKKLIKNRFYLPIGILIYVFNITSYANTLDVENILKDFASGSEIHADHFNILISKIEEIFDELPDVQRFVK